jgi:agmatinase
MKRALDHFGEDHRLLQYGIRSGTKEEYSWMKENKTIVSSRENLLKEIGELRSNRPVYLTLDIDYFDPSIAPGTGTPEAGGEDFNSLISILKALKEKNFVGADLVEVAPNIDQTGNTTIFASKVIRELILSLV